MAENETSPEAEALARVLWLHPLDFQRRAAQRAIDAGWTPPPDPHEDIARELMTKVYGDERVGWTTSGRIWPKVLGAVRRMDLRRGTDG